MSDADNSEMMQIANAMQLIAQCLEDNKVSGEVGCNALTSMLISYTMYYENHELVFYRIIESMKSLYQHHCAERGAPKH